MARWLEVEVALAQSQAARGTIPAEAAEALADSADLSRFNLAAISRGIRETNHSLIPLLDQWHRASEAEAAGYIHFGATTQDIQDTAQVLEMRDAFAIIVRDLDLLIRETARLAFSHRDTLIVGRTHGQPALPTTLGLKFAVFIDELLRHRERLFETVSRSMVCQLFGGVGNMSALGGDPQGLLDNFAQRLGLKVPDTCWHSARDRTAEITSLFALIGGSLGKMANEICQLSRDEIGEMEEPFHLGKIGSTTMPHKRNPEQCEQVVVLARLLKATATAGLDTLVNEHERDYRAVRIEWVSLSDSSMYLGAALAGLLRIMKGLIVHEDALERNMGSSACLVGSEALMFLIAAKIGKKKAHDVLYRAAMEARETRESFLETVVRQQDTAGLFTVEELRRATDPEKHVGLAREITERVIKISEKLPENNSGIELAVSPCPFLGRDGECAINTIKRKG